MRGRKTLAGVAIMATLALGVVDASARAGRGGSIGSRGARTWSAPPPTATAPSQAAPMQRTIQPQSAPRAGAAANAAPARPGFFGGAFGRGLLGGLVGAGLFGLLFGNGLFGGMGGLMSFIGLLLQAALLFFVVRLALGWWRNRSRPQTVGGAPLAGGDPRRGADENANVHSFQAANPRAAAAAAGYGAAGAGGANGRGAPLKLAPGDFEAFEQRLGAVQSAYSDENIGALRSMTTPEMAAYFDGELSDNAARGEINRISGVKLLRGDLSEAWRENGGVGGPEEFATVAMRYTLNDAVIDRATGRLRTGSTTQSQEATELWTFVRPAGSGAKDWRLSAIQQAA